MSIIIYQFEMLNPNTKSILPNTNQIFSMKQQMIFLLFFSLWISCDDVET